MGGSTEDLCSLRGVQGVFPWRESVGNYLESYSESMCIGETRFVSWPHPWGYSKIRKLDYYDDQVTGDRKEWSGAR